MGFILSTACVLFAEVSPKISEGSNNDLLQATAIYGDKISHFRIYSQENSKTLQVSVTSSDGQSMTKNLSPADFDFLKKEYLLLKAAPQMPKECRRFQAQVSMLDDQGKRINKKSCFGISTRSSPQFVHFMNELSLAIQR
jgi:hypothetical protein